MGPFLTNNPSLKKILISFGIFGVLVAIFPWLLSFQGMVLGHRLSIRSLGDIVAITIVSFGLVLIFSKRFRANLLSWVADIEASSNRMKWTLIIYTAGIYLMGVISHKLRAHAVIGTHAYDLGFFSNICWNTFSGNWFFSSELERNFMSVHVNWILWPLSYFYGLHRGAEVLLVFQAFIITAAIPVLWKITQELTGYFTFGFLSSLLFVCSPYIGHSVSNDFHPDLWLLPCLFLMLWAWKTNRPYWLLFYSLLALLAKEDVSVVLCGFALVLLLTKSWRKTGVLLMVLAISIFLFQTKVLIPKYLDSGTDSLLFGRYPLLGDNFHDMFLNLVFHPQRYVNALIYDPGKYWRFLLYFFPTAGLTFLAPMFLIPPIVSVLPHILSQASTQLSLADIYSLPSQPFIFFGSIEGAKKLLRKIGPEYTPLLCGILIIIAGIGAFQAPKYYRLQPNDRIRAFRELKSLVPMESSVCAQQNLYPHFDTRHVIQIFPIGNAMPGLRRRTLKIPEYVVCDRIGNALPYNELDLSVAIKQLEENASYKKIFERENYLLFKRIKDEPLIWSNSNP